MKKYGRSYAFKSSNTFGQQLFRLKDKADSVKMPDVTYKVQCKDWPGFYIRETTRPLDIRLKEHHAKSNKVTKARAFTHQQRKSSPAEGYKSVIAEHAAIENHMFD